MSITKKIIYVAKCKCGESIEIKKIDNLEEAKWTFSSNTFPPDENSTKNIRCPSCSGKESERLFNSQDIKERIRGGFYKAHPNLWKKDSLEFIGMDPAHPKADQLCAMAWERSHSSGYHEVLMEMENLYELLG